MLGGSLCFRQDVPATPGQPTKEPMLIPLAVGLLGPDGRDMPLSSVAEGASVQSLKDVDGTPPTTAILRIEKVIDV